MWTWKPDSLQAALTNARKRAAPFTPNDALVLGALRERYAAADTELRASRDAAKAAGEAVRVAMKQGREVAAHIKEEAGTARTRTRELEMEREGLERQALALRMRLPNETSRETPVGDGSQARIVRHGGPTNALPPQWHAAWQDAPAAGVAAFGGVEADATRDHVDLLAKYAPAALPTPAAQHVSASGFPHFGEPLASMALALENYALRRARAKGAQLRLVPDVVPSSLVALSGFAPREDDAAQVYTLSAAFNDLGLSLAGTAELPLLAMHANRTYAKEDLPIFEVALSHSFRAEAGARGRESRGLYRVHQFSKAELFVVCRAEDSGKWLEKLVDLQVEILKPLGLCWR
jgi:seryl-tRNA synthetase